MAVPGFLRRGDVNFKGVPIHNLVNFFPQKLHENDKNWAWGHIYAPPKFVTGNGRTYKVKAEAIGVNSAIHKAASFIVPGRSMISTGTIPCGTQKCPLAVNGSRRQEWPPEVVLYGGRPYGGFVNRAVRTCRITQSWCLPKQWWFLENSNVRVLNNWFQEQKKFAPFCLDSRKSYCIGFIWRVDKFTSDWDQLLYPCTLSTKITNASFLCVLRPMFIELQRQCFYVARNCLNFK